MCKNNTVGEQARPGTLRDASEKMAAEGNRFGGAIAAGPVQAQDNYIRPDGLYIHYRRGDIYRVVCMSVLDELEIGVVTYQNLRDSGFWTRTIANFNGYADQYGHPVKRFRYIGQFHGDKV